MAWYFDAGKEALTDLIADMAERLFSTQAGKFEDLWAAIEDAGLPLALLNEAEGGFGFSAPEALSILRIAARHAASSPLAETMLANRILALAGLELASGCAAVVSGLTVQDDGVLGSVPRVPWGRAVKTVVVIDSDTVIRLNAGWTHTEGLNVASEPRDDLYIAAQCQATGKLPTDGTIVQALKAAVRTVEIAGTAEAALALTVSYANDRVQFGKPLGKFQAVQQNLAKMAGEVAATRAASNLVAEAFDAAFTGPANFRLSAAVAKLRASEAAGTCAALAHQVHGAIGITQEYSLHPLSRRLWSWRDEYGSETYWAAEIGAEALKRGTGQLWPMLTSETRSEGVSAGA